MGVLNDTQLQAPNLQMYAQLFSQPRTGGAPLVPSLPMFDLFGGSPAAPAPPGEAPSSPERKEKSSDALGA